MFIKKIKINKWKLASESAMEIIRAFAPNYYLSVNVSPSGINVFIGSPREKSQDESKSQDDST